MRLFTALFGFSVFAYGVAVLIQPTDAVPSSDKIVFVAPGFSIQEQVDHLGFEGGGGTIQLQANATYYDQAIKIPWTPARTYSNIRIIGSNTRLVSPPGTETPVIWVGVGWSDWDAPKLEGLEFRGLVIEQKSLKNPGYGKGMFIEFTKGTVVKDCELLGSPFEGLYEGGGTSNEQLTVVGCTFEDCGHKYNSGPLAACNVNGFGSQVIDCIFKRNGWGLESGGTELRVTGCTFIDSPMALGSAVHGCSNQILSRNTFERSPIIVGNGIGKQADVRILDNTLIDSPLVIQGAATENRVQLPKLPFYNQSCVFTGNTVVGRSSSWVGMGIGQGVRITEWGQAFKTPPWKIQGNHFDCLPNWSVVVQGYVANPVQFIDNALPRQAGTIYLYRGQETLPDPTPMLKFERNRLPPGATMTINTGTKETQRTIN